MSIDAVIFDWGGTLTPWHAIEWGDQWRAYAAGYCGDDPEGADDSTAPADARALAGALTAAERRAWVRARDEHRSTTLAEIVSAAGLEPVGPRHERGYAAYEEFWDPHTYTDPEVHGLLAGLRERGVRVGVLSNTVWPRAFHEKVFERDGVLHLFDGAVYSSEIDWTKPHAEAFHAAMSAVGVTDPERCVFVGDRLFDDIHGAKSVGMRGVFVPHSDIPAEQRGPTDGEPDAVVDRIADLLPVVDDWRGQVSRRVG